MCWTWHSSAELPGKYKINTSFKGHGERKVLSLYMVLSRIDGRRQYQPAHFWSCSRVGLRLQQYIIIWKFASYTFGWFCSEANSIWTESVPDSLGTSLCQKAWGDRSVCLVLSIGISGFWQREKPSFCSYSNLSFLPSFPLNPNFPSRIPCVIAATMTGAVSATCSSSPHCTLSALCSQPSLSSSMWW